MQVSPIMTNADLAAIVKASATMEEIGRRLIQSYESELSPEQRSDLLIYGRAITRDGARVDPAEFFIAPETNAQLAEILEQEARARPLATVSKHLIEAAKRLREKDAQ